MCLVQLMQLCEICTVAFQPIIVNALDWTDSIGQISDYKVVYNSYSTSQF